MKWKLIGALACAVSLAIASVAPLLYGNPKIRVHQHLSAPEKQPCEREENEHLCTQLPLVVIDTKGKEIPGRPLEDTSSDDMIYIVSETGDTTVPGMISVIDSAEENNHPDDEPQLISGMTIRLRGRSSRAFDKPSYMIRLVNDDSTYNDQSVMGMAAHHEWVLYGPYLDKTLLRNYMWYNIAGEVMDWAPNVRFCEVILNSKYQGVYVMLENITSGNDGARLSLSVNKKGQHYSGYILRMEDAFGIGDDYIENFTYYTRRTRQKLEIAYPGASNITLKLAEAIEKDFSAFEKALYSYDYDSGKFGYKRFIDVESFIDYYLINEATCNYDAGWLSTYIYKDTDGLLRMCVWDMNNSCDNYYKTQVDPQRFEIQNTLWFFMLTKDEDFIEQLIERYRHLRKTVFSDEYLQSYIDGTAIYLGEAIERNYKLWGYSFEPDYDFLVPENRNPRSYEEAVESMKDFLYSRLEWMDNNIDTLRQYSRESKVKKFNENAN